MALNMAESQFGWFLPRFPRLRQKVDAKAKAVSERHQQVLSVSKEKPV